MVTIDTMANKVCPQKVSWYMLLCSFFLAKQSLKIHIPFLLSVIVFAFWVSEFAVSELLFWATKLVELIPFKETDEILSAITLCSIEKLITKKDDKYSKDVVIFMIFAF